MLTNLSDFMLPTSHSLLVGEMSKKEHFSEVSDARKILEASCIAQERTEMSKIKLK